MQVTACIFCFNLDTGGSSMSVSPISPSDARAKRAKADQSSKGVYINVYLHMNNVQ